MSKVLVAFAMKQEFAPWRRRHHFRPLSTSPHPVWRATFGATEVYAALVGAGARDASHFRDLTTQLTPSVGIVTGVAAGLAPHWQSGDLVAAITVRAPEDDSRVFSATKLLELAILCGARPAATLITLPRIARLIEEKRLLARLGDAADMESLPLMQQWSALGIPSLAVRVILDPVEMPMTCDFEAAMDSHGQVHITRIMAQLIRYPQLLPDFLRLARQSRRVLNILAGFLDRFCENLDGPSPIPSP